MLFAIDHGNFFCKSTTDIFVSGVAEHSVRPPLADDVIRYEGRYWTLTGSRIPYIRDKTRDERFFILTLFAIARELRISGSLPPYEDIELAVGLPPEHYSVLKARFAGYFKRTAVNFQYNDTTVCLSIRQVFVYPQAYAAVVPKGHMLINTPRVFIIDIGGYTTDVLLLRNGKPDLQFCRSLETGVITMNNSIIGKVGAQHDLRLEDDHIADVIQGRETILPPDVVDMIRGAAAGHTNTILDKLRELQVDLRSTQAIFIGGGAMLFRENIGESPMVAKADFIADTKANAIGYLTLAANQLRKLSLKGVGNGNA